MSIAYVFVLIFVIGMIIDFRKTIAILAPLHLILILIPFPGMPVSDFEIVSVIALVFYLCKNPFSRWTLLVKNPEKSIFSKLQLLNIELISVTFSV